LRAHYNAPGRKREAVMLLELDMPVRDAATAARIELRRGST
jgi:hypothetical protein